MMPEPSANPMKPAEMSLDYQLFFGFHLCMMVVIVAHFVLDSGFSAKW